MGQRRDQLGHSLHLHGLIYARVPAEVVVYGFTHALLIVALSPVLHVLVLLVAGCVGKALLARAADDRPVL